MYDASLLCQCWEWTKQMTDRKQEVFVVIRIGDFKFTFDSRKNAQKHKSPSQLQRNFDRQTEFKGRFRKQSCDLRKEVIETEEKTVGIKEETKPKIEVKIAETQTFATFQDGESQTDDINYNDKDTQTEEDHETEEGIGANEKGEIIPKPNENILEVKFSHDMKTWEEVKGHIPEKLRLKIIGNPWVTNNGRHFRTIAFKTQSLRSGKLKL